jgi:hypothetical protein
MITSLTSSHREFQLPVVREVIAPNKPSVAPPDSPRAFASQREVVLASLVACPVARR